MHLNNFPNSISAWQWLKLLNCTFPKAHKLKVETLNKFSKKKLFFFWIKTMKQLKCYRESFEHNWKLVPWKQITWKKNRVHHTFSKRRSFWISRVMACASKSNLCTFYQKKNAIIVSKRREKKKKKKRNKS